MGNIWLYVIKSRKKDLVFFFMYVQYSCILIAIVLFIH